VGFHQLTQIKKRPTWDRSEKEAREGGKVSGKAMQDEVEANAQTLGLEKTTFLEEVKLHVQFLRPLLDTFSIATLKPKLTIWLWKLGSG
jgi:hypothetical protein